MAIKPIKTSKYKNGHRERLPDHRPQRLDAKRARAVVRKLVEQSEIERTMQLLENEGVIRNGGNPVLLNPMI